MKLATYNINSITRRLPNLLDWLAEAEPDIVCLQELKAATPDFPIKAIEQAGYGAVWRGQSAWNGVAILQKGGTPVLTRNALPDDPDEKQPRYIEAAVNGTLVACLYAPNGNPQPGPKFDYKLNWNERLIAHAAELFASGLPVVIAGDFNIVPTPFDMYESKSYDDNALVQPAPREQFVRLLAQGWVDAIRKKHPKEQVFTFWDYMRKRWERNGGLRLDHILLSKPLARKLIDAGVDRDVRGRPEASDHAPVWVTLKD
ncbi:MAG TPA: exodeoxyribonuclease III [Devosia sp.]|mgnify:CR=1 FL=1|nr:exodeoxyribonuclease III [Devosia sp.]